MNKTGAVQLLAALQNRGLTLASCESLTGGLFASELVAIPGASNAFLGALVTYQDESKQALAGVRPETLAAFGAVSGPCAMEMARGAGMRLNADVAVAMTGCAGPSSDKRGTPVGDVFIGIAGIGGEETHFCHFSGTRTQIRRQCVRHAIHLVYHYLLTIH